MAWIYITAAVVWVAMLHQLMCPYIRLHTVDHRHQNHHRLKVHMLGITGIIFVIFKLSYFLENKRYLKKY